MSATTENTNPNDSEMNKLTKHYCGSQICLGAYTDRIDRTK